MKDCEPRDPVHKIEILDQPLVRRDRYELFHDSVQMIAFTELSLSDGFGFHDARSGRKEKLAR
jgi:hypothetical protein